METDVSIHAPRAGCDFKEIDDKLNRNEFQSTHPARGATCSATRRSTPATGFNPRTPRGVRRGISPSRARRTECFNPRTPRGVRRAQGAGASIACRFQSTHPARGATAATAHRPPPHGRFNPRTPRGVRPTERSRHDAIQPFQSTHPARGATLRGRQAYIRAGVSIHAPRAGCDLRAAAT